MKKRLTGVVDPELGKPGWYIRRVINTIKTLLRLRFGKPPVVHGRNDTGRGDA